MAVSSAKTFKPIFGNTVHLLPSDRPCDTGSDLKTIASEFPELEFSTVDPVFPDKSAGTPYTWTRAANIARGKSCLQDLYNRPEKVIAVVSHAGFLRTGVSRRRYANADYRVFSFEKGTGGEMKLREDERLSGTGGAMGRSEEGDFRIVRKDFPSEDPTNVD